MTENKDNLQKILDICENVKETMTYDNLIKITDPGDGPEFDVNKFADDYKYQLSKDGRSGEIESTNPNLAAKGEDNDELRRKILIECGLDPDQCRIVGRVSISSSKWTNQGYKNRAQRYRYQIEFINPLVDEISEDIDRLISYKFENPVPEKTNGNKVLNLVLADLQLGKQNGGGTKGIVERVANSISIFAEKIEKEKPDAVAIHFNGDCVEGNQSQKSALTGHNSIDLTVTEQTRVLRRIILSTIKHLAPVSPELHIIVVPGNHDELQRFPATKAGDNHATESAIAVEETIREADSLTSGIYSHVKIHYPKDYMSYLTVKIKDTVFLEIHGHQFKRGKASEWWKTATFNMDGAGMAHFMVHGHEHQSALYQVGSLGGSGLSRTVICGGSSEGRSDWFNNISPGSSFTRPGGSYFITEGAKWSDYSIF